MSIIPDNYPLDLTAEQPRNKVTDELRTFVNEVDRVFIPAAGPFFVRSFIIKDANSEQPLKPNLDFKILHLLEDATKVSGYSVCAVVYVTNPEITKVTMDYQVIGGEYGDLAPMIREFLINNPVRSIDVDWFTQVHNKPDSFLPAAHYHSGEDFSEWDRISIRLDEIIQAMVHKDRYSWQAVYDYLNRKIDVTIGNYDPDKLLSRIVELETQLRNEKQARLDADTALSDRITHIEQAIINGQLRYVSFDGVTTPNGNKLTM